MSVLARLREMPRGFEGPGSGATPIAKWVGGKTRLLPELIARMPKTFNRYIEPFAGGAALFWRVGPREATLADINQDLICLYRQVRDDVDGVIRVLTELDGCYKGAAAGGALTEVWNSWREHWNRRSPNDNDTERAALFSFLNRTCFNGLWRVNSKGEFNVPIGDYKNPRIVDEVGLRAANKALQSVALHAGDYHSAVAGAGAQSGDFVYFDPPYDPLTKTANFTAYAPGGFGDDDQRVLAKCFTDLANRGVRVMLSNSDTPFVRDLYARHQVDSVTCGRAISSKGTTRGKVGEVIVTAGY